MNMRGDRNFKGSDSSDPSVYFLFCDVAESYYVVNNFTIKNNFAVLLAVLNDVARTPPNMGKSTEKARQLTDLTVLYCVTIHAHWPIKFSVTCHLHYNTI